MDVWDIKKGLIIHAGEKNILQSIININFRSLRSLNIYENKIESIEILSWLDAPNLQTIALGTSIIIEPAIESLLYNLYVNADSLI